MNCGLIIPTLNAGKNFQTLLEQIAAQDLPLKKLIVDSESTDVTVKLAERFNFDVLPIRRKSFNHGATRQLALEYLLEKFSIDAIIFLTQDVLLYDEKTLSTLVKIFDEDSTVGLTYGRQLPHKDAILEAKILRQFNYPAESQLRSFNDKKFYGIKTALNSNSFSAYRIDALKKIGGFPTNAILSEDMYVAAKMLLDDWKIFYNAAAQVYHSHNYTATQEFHRYFDIGVFHSRESWIRDNFGSAEGAGKKFVLMKLKALWKENPLDCISAICRDGAKFFGYRLGRIEKFLPKSLCQLLAMHKNYFK